MKPRERRTQRPSSRTGIDVGATVRLALSSTFARRMALAALLAATTFGGASATPGAPETNDKEIRPFRVRVPDEALADLRYWGTEYDWRKVEAKLNALPQFITTIDGIDIHFIHVRSRHPNALPVIITHGWPGSIIEQLNVIGPLTDPTAHGGRAPDAFDVVIPSMPGYGFSGKPTAPGWNPDRNLTYFNEVDKGGHFAAWEEPQLFAAELRAAFRSIR